MFGTKVPHVAGGEKIHSTSTRIPAYLNISDLDHDEVEIDQIYEF